MARYLLRSLVRMIVAIWGISVMAFVLTYVIGDPVTVLLPWDTPREAREEYRRQMGLDQPLAVQYLRFAGGAVRGDFGNSFYAKKPATSLVLERMPATLILTFSGLILALAISIPAGVISAYKRYTWIDNVVTILAIAGQAMPIFWFGLMLIILFAVNLRLLPASGYGTWQNLVLPAVCLSVFLAPITMRLMRSGMLDVLHADYVRTARSKGLTEATVLLRHAIRNALIPVVAVVGLQFGQLLGGAIVTETVFAWPGVASLVVNAIRNTDYPIVQAAVMLLAGLITVINLVTDATIYTLDPRISRQ
jgi:peptide/nickel transport system permease protein